MSLFNDIFGNDKRETKLDKKVSTLFSAPLKTVPQARFTGPRTVIETPKNEDSEESQEASKPGKESEVVGEASYDTKIPSQQKKRSKHKDEDDDLEGRYFKQLMKNDEEKDLDSSEKQSGPTLEKESSILSDDSEVENVEVKETKRAMRPDMKEDELEKAEKTVFVGNVSYQVILSKVIYKKFKKLFSYFGKVQSIRFRSISFDEALPRKAAFAKRKIHGARDSVNAYVVFTEKEPSLKCIRKLNASIFEDLHIRVDHVAHPSPKENKKTIFVGNLDFEEKEENLWRYFNSKTNNDVVSVRLVRDSKTNLGKGFALIQFKDTLSVNKAVLLNGQSLPSNPKRKLRITKAKANTKPSALSPNHQDNPKFSRVANKVKNASLTDSQKTKLGRAVSILGKADKATAGRQKSILEGQRSTKGDRISGIKGHKGRQDKKKVKKPRIRERSQKYKEALKSVSK